MVLTWPILEAGWPNRETWLQASKARRFTWDAPFLSLYLQVSFISPLDRPVFALGLCVSLWLIECMISASCLYTLSITKLKEARKTSWAVFYSFFGLAGMSEESLYFVYSDIRNQFYLCSRLIDRISSSSAVAEPLPKGAEDFGLSPFVAIITNNPLNQGT